MRRSGIDFHRPGAFWTGATLITLGVLAHLPDFVAARGMQYQMAGMPVGGLMIAGMVFVAGGMGLATWGLLPPPRHRLPVARD